MQSPPSPQTSPINASTTAHFSLTAKTKKRNLLELLDDDWTRCDSSSQEKECEGSNPNNLPREASSKKSPSAKKVRVSPDVTKTSSLQSRNDPSYKFETAQSGVDHAITQAFETSSSRTNLSSHILHITANSPIKKQSPSPVLSLSAKPDIEPSSTQFMVPHAIVFKSSLTPSNSSTAKSESSQLSGSSRAVEMRQEAGKVLPVMRGNTDGADNRLSTCLLSMVSRQVVSVEAALDISQTCSVILKLDVEELMARRKNRLEEETRRLYDRMYEVTKTSQQHGLVHCRGGEMKWTYIGEKEKEESCGFDWTKEWVDEGLRSRTRAAARGRPCYSAVQDREFDRVIDKSGDEYSIDDDSEEEEKDNQTIKYSKKQNPFIDDSNDEDVEWYGKYNVEKAKKGKGKGRGKGRGRGGRGKGKLPGGDGRKHVKKISVVTTPGVDTYFDIIDKVNNNLGESLLSLNDKPEDLNSDDINQASSAADVSPITAICNKILLKDRQTKSEEYEFKFAGPSASLRCRGRLTRAVSEEESGTCPMCQKVMRMGELNIHAVICEG